MKKKPKPKSKTHKYLWNLPRLMKERNVTTGKIAEALGVCRSVVYTWTTFESRPNYENLHKLAAFLDCTPEDLTEDDTGLM